ncbi:LysR family transcriptional regulator [Roseixanthobacter liquoris]|uniref:LysR family transcriptional regulator n=1 Tax=Roseixanthobacter liquoris TaxID=3119921 RepID=UPI00372C6653
MDRTPRPLANVNLKFLKTFLLVAEHSSFRTAALHAHRSPSAISTQIKQLEAQIGVALFHRTTRSVRLTAEGEQLQDYARRAVHELEFGLVKLEEAADLRRGRVSLSCSPTVAGSRLARVLAAFERDYPAIQVFVRELTSEALHKSVREKEVDFGIGPVTATEEFQFEHLLQEELYALVPKRFLTSKKTSIPLEALQHMPLLLLNPATALRELFERKMRELGFTFTTHFQFTQAQTLISMAEAGLGAAILPKIALPETIGATTRALRIVDPSLMRELAVISLKGQSFSPAASRLVDLLRKYIV